MVSGKKKTAERAGLTAAKQTDKVVRGNEKEAAEPPEEPA